MPDLEKYKAKRHADRTPEPFGREDAEGQRADLRRAAPLGPTAALRLPARARRRAAELGAAPRRAAARRRAGARRARRGSPARLRGFEGEIPAGEYGGGTVDIWDHGTYELLHERPDGMLTVILHGERLEGEWALVPSKLDGNEKNWLIVRASKLGALGPARAYELMRAREAKRVPAGKEWAFELAWEGVRALVARRGREGPLRARRGRVARRPHCAAPARPDAPRAAHQRVRARRCDLRARRGRPAEPRAARSRRRHARLHGRRRARVRRPPAGRRVRGRRGARRCSSCSTSASTTCASHAPTTTGRSCATPRVRSASASWPSGGPSRYRPGAATDDWRASSRRVSRAIRSCSVRTVRHSERGCTPDAGCDA